MTRYAFAGDRALAVRILSYLLARGDVPAALLTSAGPGASHAGELAAMVDAPHLQGDAFRSPQGLATLRSLDLEMVVCVHFPYLVPAEALAIPSWGWLNLHPAYLPYNRGWHTATWAILDGTPAGATLHLMSEDVDAGPIVAQAQAEVLGHDTAHSLYQRLLELEYEVFTGAWPAISSGDRSSTEQDHARATMHRRADLSEALRRIEPGEVTKLRALSTSNPDEAAFFDQDGRRYRVQVRLEPDEQGA